MLQQFEKEDAVAITLRFHNGALGNFLLSDQTPSPWSWEGATGENAAFPKSGENPFRFMGTEGALEFPILKLWKHQGTPIDWRYPLESRLLPTDLEDAFVLQLDHFADVVQGRAEPLVDAVDATASLRATLAVYESAKTGQRVTL